jgi:catechol 2,3-dioxygenase-like lactoylglutathione lyase family enzyme
MIKGLHHNAYRCRDSEQTRRFYEVFLGLPLSGSLEIRETKTGRTTAVLHTFYRLDDGSYVIELTAKTPEHARLMDPATNGARTILDRWQAAKPRVAAGAD